MAKRVTEYRRSLIPPPSDRAPARISYAPGEAPLSGAPLGMVAPEFARDVREMANTAFSELDAGELRFALAEQAEAPAPDAAWHTLEPGEAAPAPKSRVPGPPQIRSVFTKTLPPPWMGDAELEPVSPSRIEFSAPPPFRVPRIADPLPIPTVLPVPPVVVHPLGAPSLLVASGDRGVELLASGMALVRPEAAGFACRLDALRVVAGSVTTQPLRRRAREAESSDVLGGTADPLVGLLAQAGEVQLVLGPRPGRRLVVLSVDEGLAFMREDLLLGFELALTYENGRVALEEAGGKAPGSDGLGVVQLRGTGALVLEPATELAALPSQAGRALLVRRDWIVGWFGRLVARSPLPSETPGGQRGLVAFWGEGTVFVAVQ